MNTNMEINQMKNYQIIKKLTIILTKIEESRSKQVKQFNEEYINIFNATWSHKEAIKEAENIREINNSEKCFKLACINKALIEGIMEEIYLEESISDNVLNKL